MKALYSRADVLRLAAGSVSLLALPSMAWSAETPDAAIFKDPDLPTAGNPNGDITIVDFFDYNCPYCKKSAPHLERLVATDGNIKLIYCDWPILHETSIVGAQLALGAKYQGKYLAASEAMMKIPGYGVAQDKMIEAVSKAGVDMARLDKDVKEHRQDILAVVKRTLAAANSAGFKGTPAYLVGSVKVNEALDYDGFQRVVADARARMKDKK